VGLAGNKVEKSHGWVRSAPSVVKKSSRRYRGSSCAGRVESAPTWYRLSMVLALGFREASNSNYYI
jgi:hypothetical protein